MFYFQNPSWFGHKNCNHVSFRQANKSRNARSRKDPQLSTKCEVPRLKENKISHIFKEKRRELTPSNKEEAQIKEFNSDYIKVNGVPPFSALRIKNGSGYQLYYTSDLSKMTFAKIHLVPQEGNSPCNPVTEEDIKRVKIQLP